MGDVAALLPAILLLVIGILSIICMGRLGLSPIVGYMIGGLLIGEHAFGALHESSTVHLLAELGVVFLLFDIGLHFSVRRIWEARRDIFGLAPIQIALCTIAFGGLGLAIGLPFEIALIGGGALALSSTAVVQPTLVDRGQTNCPVGRTSTAVLILQDVFAIFLLIFAASLGGDEPGVEGKGLTLTIGLAAAKGMVAFVLAILLGRVAVRPLFTAISRARNEEIFTAVALLLVLATSAGSGWAGLSLTLGAFLGGMMLSETPFRHLIRTEAKPFRDLLLGFFFISIGMSLDWRILLDDWWQILAFTSLIIAIKAVAIMASSRIVGWSLPGSIQLGSLLSQGSEFVFVILSMTAVRAAFGEEAVGVIFISVAISLALTPSMAALGARIAQRIKRRAPDSASATESISLDRLAPVVIIRMGAVGRTVADALEAHQIKYDAIEDDFDRFTVASADGFPVTLGNVTDLRFGHTMSMDQRAAIVVTNARLEKAKELMPTIHERYPDLARFASIDDEAEVAAFVEIGMVPVVDHGSVPGLDLAVQVLKLQGVDEERINSWSERRRQNASPALEAAVA